MPKETAQRRLMDEQDLIRWREATMTAVPDKETVHIASDASDHSDYISLAHQTFTDFHKSTIQLRKDRKHSLLTKALQPSHEEDGNPQMYVATDMARHRSTRSNTSTASTAELTSDGGLTSPDRASTPSPPFPTATYMSFVPYTLGPKLSQAAFARTQQAQNSVTQQQLEAAPMPQPDPAVEALVRKRCVSFACGGQRPNEAAKPACTVSVENNGPCSNISPPKRTIKFACQAPKPERQGVTLPQPPKVPQPTVVPASPPKTVERHNSRSPSMTRRLRPPPSPQSKSHRDSTSTVRRASQSPAAVRSRKPKYIVADEEALQSSEATRFHEFASDELQEDDWIRKDASHTKAKLTISDTLKKENAIRQLGKEAEEEALEDEDDDEDEGNDDSDDDNDDDDEDIEDDDDNTVDGSDVDLDASDGNETDNEAGFADSDDESDPTGEYQFWIPLTANSGEVNTFRSSARRASESSIDSLSHMSPIMEAKGVRSGRMKPSRRIRIRPGTPDLPDSTDFVCGTLDEDRPLEDAYVSCMEARRREKHHIIPQDIDPSFPTSEPEDEQDETDEVEQAHDSDDAVWFHGKFEDSDSENRRRRRRKSPKQSPKRLHSPPPPTKHRSPPATTRYRSPPPRPRHAARSPPPTRIIYSPPISPANLRNDVIFAPLGARPGLTHTKSLPRRPNGFSQQYLAARLAAANMMEENDNTDGYTRGAIDIVKGLEQKRQRRKDKFFSKLCNRARKGQQVERRPQPGKGAERMRELGLQMAGKTAADYKNGKAEYVLSV